MTDLTCEQVRPDATEYALGILPADDAGRVSAHLLRCHACRREIDEIRRIGEQLLDLVPDTEPPLGFDQKVLSTLHSSPRAPKGRSRRHQLMFAAAAAVLVIAGAVTAVSLSNHGHPGRPDDLTAVLRQADRNVGSIYIGGHPTWISMTVDRLSAAGKVDCQLIFQDGTAADVGTFQLVDGRGAWGAPDPEGGAVPTAVRLVGPTGDVLATASFDRR